MDLPSELVDSLNQTYFLHLLVNDKNKVVPPGKSVLSMLVHANFRLRYEPDSAQQPNLSELVKEAAHKAFWKEAAEVLSSPMPFVQLPRLRSLYLDLHEALKPLFPPNHHILITLAAPPPPTSSPLLSTTHLLKEIVTSMRQRCAPIRDQQADTLLSTISNAPPYSTHLVTKSLERSTPELQVSILSQFIIDTIKAILVLADDMKSDLNNFTLGSMSEQQLIDVLSSEVRSQERDFVISLWDGKAEIRDLWLLWSMESPRRDKISESTDNRWVDRLFKALEADRPVFCAPPKRVSNMSNGATPHINNLPPQLLFVVPALVNIQNYLQAIVITAALNILANPRQIAKKSLIPLPKDSELRSDFVQHIWTLLEAEIDTDAIENTSFDNRSTDLPEMKLVNLADEVVERRRTLAGVPLKPDEEKRVRDTVDRTLRTSDPVFLVLRKRLFDALEDKLLEAMNNPSDNALSSSKHTIPVKMQTGRGSSGPDNRAEIGATQEYTHLDLRLKALLEGAPGTKKEIGFEILGFDHDTLRKAIAEAYGKLVRCVAWTELVWGNDLKT